MRILAANLLAHRKARKLSRAKVEEQTGISAGVLAQYEKDPGTDAYFLAIMRLARFYKTTAEDLLTNPDPNIPTSTTKTR